MDERPTLEGYDFTLKLSTSPYMNVWIVLELHSKQKYAVAVIPNFRATQRRYKLLETLIETYRKLNHPAIAVPVKFFLPADGKNTLFIFYNTEGTTSVYSQIKKQRTQSEPVSVTLQQVYVYIIALISAIAYLHENNIVCHDISTKLLVIDNDSYPHLVAYGLCQLYYTDSEDMKLLEMTVMPPELRLDFRPSKKSDIFQFGTCLFTMFSPKTLVTIESIFRRMVEVMRRGYTPIVTESMPGFLQSILFQCWGVDPLQRPTAIFIQNRLVYNIELFLKGATDQTYFNYLNRLNDNVSEKYFTSLASIANEINLLSNKGKKLAFRYIMLQECILSVTSRNIDYTFRLICEHVKPAKDKEHIVSFFLTATQCRFLLIKEIADLFNRLTTSIPQFSDLPKLFLSNFIKSILYVEPLPDYIGAIQFIFFLNRMGVYKDQELIREFHYLYEKTPNKNNLCLPFCWFANLFYEHDRPIYQTMMTILKNHENDDFFPECYRNFMKKYNNFQKNKFAFYTSTLPSGNSGSKFRRIVKSDAQKDFIEYMNKKKSDEKLKVSADVFEPCPVIKEESLVHIFIDIYGASSIWYSMVTRHPINMPKEKILRKFIQYCVMGGSETIITNAMQMRCSMEGTPQIAAVYHRNEVFINFLRGTCDLTLPDKDGKLVITTAAGSNNIFILLCCLQCGMSINSREPFGWTPLHSAAAKGTVEVMEVLFQIHGIDVNARDIWGCTPLHVATDKMQYRAVKILLKNKNIKPNMVNEDGKTAFIMAVEGGEIEIIQLFMNSKINKTIATSKGTTALHIAATKSLQVFELVAKNSGIDPTSLDKKGRTALDIARNCGNKEVVDAIENYNQKYGSKCNIA